MRTKTNFGHAMNQIESDFSNASGDIDSDFEGEFMPADGNYFAADGDLSAGAPMDNAVAIPDFDRTYTITIENTDVVTQNVILFGANQFLTSPTFGNNPAVTLTVGESSYLEMIQESQLTPFQISGFRLTSSSATQLDQVLKITKRTGNGQICTYPLQVGNYFSAFQYQPTIREVYPYNIYFEGTTNIQFPVFAGVTVVMTLFVGKRLDTSNKMKGRAITEVSPHSLPFVKKQTIQLVQQAPNVKQLMR